MKTVPNNQSVIILGQSGSGKQLLATQRVIDNLAEGRKVVILDSSRNYVPLVRCLGGALVEGGIAHTYGTMPLTVVDLEDQAEPLQFAQLPVPEFSADTFVLVSEAVEVARAVRDLWASLDAAIARGAVVCVVMRKLDDVAGANLPKDLAKLNVRNRSLVFDGEWSQNQLCRHQDGGIYRFLFTSKHTEDLSELVQYEHVWPFEPGAKWSRPVDEWPSRFTPITAADLAEAKKTDRATAQANIAKAKASRRAAAK